MQRLTQGRYRRVWTPLGENVLRVDDADGQVLPVEALSRGTREQLFLSLRLALAACYARRGAPLPLVLDDVLVNFDAERAGAAAAVLRDFAAAGHQVLVFTCHEHILRLFQTLKAPVARLPDARESAHAAVVLEELAKEKPKRARKPPAPAQGGPAPSTAAAARATRRRASRGSFRRRRCLGHRGRRGRRRRRVGGRPAALRRRRRGGGLRPFALGLWPHGPVGYALA